MTEKLKLFREVLSAAPDGNSVRRTETIDVEITHNQERSICEKPEWSYCIFGEWRILESVQ